MGFFSKKNILITGASYGLGSLIAKELSKEQCNLILVSRSKDKLKKTYNLCAFKKNHHTIISDFQSHESIFEMTKIVAQKFKKLDIIMHIAGGGLGVKDNFPIRSDYLKVFNLNLFSIFEINRELVPLIKKNRGGTIFHVGSVVANESIGSISYNCAKTALAAYVRTLSKTLSSNKICVTGINPGAFEIEQNAMYRLKKNNLNAYKSFINNRLPSKKMPKGESFIDIIKLLIGKNNMIFSGNMISCDSGEGNFYKQYLS